MAVDRKGLLGTLIPSEAQVATQMVIPRIAGHNPELDKHPFPYDPAKAKALLAEAKAGGTKIDTPIDFYCRTGLWPTVTETCEAMQTMFKAVGLNNITLKMIDVSVWNDFNAHPSKGPNNPAGDTKIASRAPMLLGHSHDNNLGDPVFTQPCEKPKASPLPPGGLLVTQVSHAHPG